MRLACDETSRARLPPTRNKLPMQQCRGYLVGRARFVDKVLLKTPRCSDHADAKQGRAFALLIASRGTLETRSQVVGEGDCLEWRLGHVGLQHALAIFLPLTALLILGSLPSESSVPSCSTKNSPRLDCHREFVFQHQIPRTGFPNRDMQCRDLRAVPSGIRLKLKMPGWHLFSARKQRAS